MNKNVTFLIAFNVFLRVSTGKVSIFCSREEKRADVGKVRARAVGLWPHISHGTRTEALARKRCTYAKGERWRRESAAIGLWAKKYCR